MAEVHRDEGRTNEHHAFCSSRALAGQLDVNSLALWYQSVAMLRSAVAGWQSKGSKHMAVTLPLQTQLLCLDSDSAFLHGINSLVDNLSKQLRVMPAKQFADVGE